MLDQCFEFSMMTVLNEGGGIQRYFYISFVEFLDMLCRIAIVAITVSDTLDQNVQRLLVILYKNMYEKSILFEDTFPLRNFDDIP